jgi:hypothetical protein
MERWIRERSAVRMLWRHDRFNGFAYAQGNQIMSGTITVEKGLAAYFKQPSGESRPGVDWLVRISGARAGTALVRTYFSTSPPQEAEKQLLAAKAVAFIRNKLEQSWIPKSGVFLEAE